ncbi:dTDP-4-dehydrorhamnose 3,5-epimerase family protein [Streptomyces sp. URMC 125]|uniref:dTDP-4-dehydrorhamnose 3,5-epimerase family protein n=1 Tax=Streptomyces sp. URMC 125 TaxID=3423419 RepID=UPI003F1B6170
MSGISRTGVRRLGIPGVCVVTPLVHSDGRGAFLEWFHAGRLEEMTGRPATVAQINVSVSRKGALRGIHYTDVPPGQAKFFSCLKGSVLDVVVDVRVGSPTYGRWEAVRLDDRTYQGVHVPEGVGHAFMALADDTVVAYTCSQPYTPLKDRKLHPLDASLAIPWPQDAAPLISPGDRAAPTLAEARQAGILPEYEKCVRNAGEWWTG